ncbi:MAG TPA: S-methyl-5-thioribose-1-phosphate isomerase [bacterium]|nr:S-methyl-5-thioribose-1-phosphate isomerase [bacterium]HPN42272.1 S-methyl-5-thioribose-1-phosphate isomerase [bacterium]
MDDIKTIQWVNGKVRLLDQAQLPEELVLLEISDHNGIVNAIKNMNLRGAPAIGIAAAFGVVLAVWNVPETDRSGFLVKANKAIDELKATRPTAKNLFWALDKMRNALSRNLNKSIRDLKQALLKEAQEILEDDIQRCKTLGKHGVELLQNRANVLTHCNAGALATGDYGTALGILRAGKQAGKKIKVYVDETRPLFQGARLTAFELMEDGFDVTLICDNMAAFVMQQGLVNIVIVGADRIARNGDVANKIGTYGLAVIAQKHNIPFVVAAPLSTFDFTLETGRDIPIEERAPEEVTKIGAKTIAPEGVKVYNPAFDITPHYLIHAIVTEKGIIKPPFWENIAKLAK